MISIIIPTKNEQHNLGRCLESIRDNGYSSYEVIVVDQESTDSTQKIAKKFGAKVIIVPKTDQYLPPSHSRNIGFDKSKGEIIYHLDADMELEPGLLQEIVNIFKSKSISAIVVPERDVPGNFWARGKAFERSLYFNTPMEAARVSRRKVFASTKYDSQITSGEDWQIHSQFSRLGNISRTKKTVKHHIGVLSLSREMRKKRHYGQGSENFLSVNRLEMFKRFVLLFKIYTIGTVKNLFVNPLAVFAFVVLRLVDLLALVMGFLLK